MASSLASIDWVPISRLGLSIKKNQTINTCFGRSDVWRMSLDLIFLMWFHFTLTLIQYFNRIMIFVWSLEQTFNWALMGGRNAYTSQDWPLLRPMEALASHLSATLALRHLLMSFAVCLRSQCTQDYGRQRVSPMGPIHKQRAQSVSSRGRPNTVEPLRAETLDFVRRLLWSESSDPIVGRYRQSLQSVIALDLWPH